MRRLLELLERPVTFVVGKGGVGKTTTAGGIALATADAGTATHLVSTDPAHSLADLFGLESRPGEVVESTCGLALTVEEVDASAVATTYLNTLEPALRELLDRGTYLDEGEIDSLLAGSLPGLDEIGAALRLADLADTPRLVVDTAPTGHTLRLLDVPGTLDRWLDVFSAMATKADTVATALVGQTVRLGAEAALDELGRRMRRFRDLLADADFVLVTAAGEVVEAETERLRKALTGRGLRIACTVAVEDGGPKADVVLPRRSGLVGCDALRAWVRGEAPASAPTSVRPAGPGAFHEAGVGALLDRDLLVFAGKGGVGKSTSAAAAAVRLAEGGRVALVGADPADSLRDVLPDPPEGVEVHELDADAEMERFRSRYVDAVEQAFAALGLDRSARLDRDVVERLWGLAPPGLDELVAVARLADDEGGRVVLDTAPTGHFLRLLSMPAIARDWVLRITRILVKYQALGGLDAPAESLVRFARKLRALQERLFDPSRTGIILVTLDEALVRSETRRLADTLREQGAPVTAILVNRTGAGADSFQRDFHVPVLTAPTVPEPRGRDRLAAFSRTWRRS